MAQAGDTREELIEVTMHLMWAHGYGGVSVDRICKDAGVNKGSFYHFFPSKQALVLEAMERAWTIARTGLYDVAFDPALPPLERFSRLIEISHDAHRRLRADAGTELGCPFGNLGGESGPRDEAIRAKSREMYEREAAYFRHALQDAVDQGAIAPLDVEDTARQLVALQTGLYTHAKVYDDVDWLLLFVPAAARLLGARVVDGKLAPAEPVAAG